MRKMRRALSGLLGAGILLGSLGLSGCGDPEVGSAPKMKGSKDEIQKGMFKDQPEPVTTKKR